MRASKWSYLLFLVVVLFSISSHPSQATDLKEETEDDKDVGIVELNPNYRKVEPGDESDDESEGEVEQVDEDSPKSVLAKALRSSRSAPKRVLQAFKKHKVKFTIALVVFAFRRELYQGIMHLIGTPKIDPTTGKEIGRQLSLSPTAMLKIALFLHFMIQLRRGNPAGAFSAVILAGPNGLLLSRLLTRFLQPEQINAYIPPIEQHWTFERLNECYEKDVHAYNKAMTTFGNHRSTISNVAPPKSLQKALESLLSTPASVPAVQVNGTAIVVDMTGLDSGVTTLSVIRDQVSYLIQIHRTRTETNEIARNIQLSPSAKETNTSVHIDNATAAAQSNTTLPFNSATTSAQITSGGEQPETEIIVLLESPGGEVAAYGMAAQQILRLRNEPGITVTICVDKVAASGGYMMACCASDGHLFATSFAAVGSIGVFGSIVNIHEALEGWGIKPIVLKAGKNKAPLGLIGPVTAEGKASVQSIIDKTHVAFKRHVATSRPILEKSIDEIATGDVWLGCDALEVGLVDRLVSSDEYIGERMKDNVRVLKLVRNVPKWRFGSPSSGYLPFATQIRQGFNSLLTKFQQAFAEAAIESTALVKSRAATNIHAKVHHGSVVQ